MRSVEMGGMKMSCMRWVGIMAAAGVLALGSGGVGNAKTILQEDFRSAESSGKDGQILKKGDQYFWKGAGGNSTVERGGYRMYDIRGLNPDAGTVEFDITRAGSQESETLFSFGDEKGHELFGLNLNWESVSGDEPPLIRTSGIGRIFYQQEKGDYGIPYTYGGVLLGRSIGKGQTFHVAFTWGAGGPRVYIDGKLLDAEVENEDGIAKAILKTKKFLVGGRIGGPAKTDVWDTPSSLIANVQVHDTQLKPSELGSAFSTGVAIGSVTHDAFKAAGFSGKLVAGNNLQVTVSGATGAVGSFDVLHYTDLAGTIPLDWRGWGVYLEDKVFFEEGEINLADVEGYRVFASLTPIPAITEEMVPLATLEVGAQSYTIDSLAVDTPYYVAVVAEMRDGSFKDVIKSIQGVPLAESSSGVYTGGYAVTYADKLPLAVVIGRLAKAGAIVALAAEKTVVIDPALNVTVTSSEEVLKADEKSTAVISVTVTNANGDPVADHEIKFLLATTSQYTGVVGGGAFKEQVGGSVQESTWGKTDLFGKMTATYVAGFAAKTAVIVARDMASNSTGAVSVKTFIQATAQIELTPVNPTAAMDQGYEIKVTTSDDWLTADGKSQARITAQVTQAGKPVKGHSVSFSASAGMGTIRTVSDTTDSDGKARAVYTAGKKIGIALVTATDTTVGISGSVQIELRSDAPAKIAIKIDPEKLPADGRSRADLDVLVTDINDNPNDNVEVEYALSAGSGKLRDGKNLTDRRGEAENVYTAGDTPGMVTISLVVRSLAPTEEEMAKARNLALAVPHYDFR